MVPMNRKIIIDRTISIQLVTYGTKFNNCCQQLFGSLPLNPIGTSGNSGFSINQSTRGELLSNVDVSGGGSDGELSILSVTIGIDSNRRCLNNHQISSFDESMTLNFH
ncbi:hypothetical protein BLOT_015457, partial [Blomia tropicalis]